VLSRLGEQSYLVEKTECRLAHDCRRIMTYTREVPILATSDRVMSVRHPNLDLASESRLYW
jgi:hypothetical protein